MRGYGPQQLHRRVRLKEGTIPQGAVPFGWLDPGDYFFEIETDGKPVLDVSWRKKDADAGPLNAQTEEDRGDKTVTVGTHVDYWTLVLFDY